MAEIVWTAESVLWLNEIYEYIAQDNIDAAQTVIEEIRAKVRHLAKFPDMGFIYREEPEGQIRILLYGHYRIAYIRIAEQINVLGIFHGSLDIEKYI